MEIPEFSAKNDIFYQKLKTIISSNRPQYNDVNICSFEPYFQVGKLRFSIFLVIFDFFLNPKMPKKRRKSGFTSHYLRLMHCYYGAYFAVLCSFVKMGLFWGSKFEFFGGFSNFSHFYLKKWHRVDGGGGGEGSD